MKDVETLVKRVGTLEKELRKAANILVGHSLILEKQAQQIKDLVGSTRELHLREERKLEALAKQTGGGKDGDSVPT